MSNQKSTVLHKVLGTALNDAEAARQLVKDIPKQMFDGANEKIFEKILLVSDQEVYDPSAVIGLLTGDEQNLAIEYRNHQVFGSFSQLLQKYKELWEKKQAETHIKQMRDAIMDPSVDARTLFQERFTEFSEAQKLVLSEFTKDEYHFAQKIFKDSRDRSESGNTAIGVPIPISLFVEIANSLMLGELYVVGGRTGMGKSFWAGLMKTMVEEMGYPVGRITPEMTGESLAYRDASLEVGVDILKLMAGDLTDEQWDKFLGYVMGRKGRPSYVDDQAVLFFEDIHQKILGFVRQGCQVIFIDYIQIVVRKDGNKIMVGDVSSLLARLAKQYNVCIVGLAQLNRDTDSGGDRRPMINHIYNGDRIAQDSYMIMMVYRPYYYGFKEDNLGRTYPDGYMEVIVRKHRGNGTMFTMRFMYTKHGLIEVDADYNPIRVCVGPNKDIDEISKKLFSPEIHIPEPKEFTEEMNKSNITIVEYGSNEIPF